MVPPLFAKDYHNLRRLLSTSVNKLQKTSMSQTGLSLYLLHLHIYIYVGPTASESVYPKCVPLDVNHTFMSCNPLDRYLERQIYRSTYIALKFFDVKKVYVLNQYYFIFGNKFESYAYLIFQYILKCRFSARQSIQISPLNLRLDQYQIVFLLKSFFFYLNITSMKDYYTNILSLTK